MILKGERESNRYIGMLSKLLRFTLEMSTKESISLEEEIDYLDALYYLKSKVYVFLKNLINYCFIFNNHHNKWLFLDFKLPFSFKSFNLTNENYCPCLCKSSN